MEREYIFVNHHKKVKQKKDYQKGDRIRIIGRHPLKSYAGTILNVRNQDFLVTIEANGRVVSVPYQNIRQRD